MSITPKPVLATESLTVRLPKEVLELLDDYCRFLGGATDRTYIVTEALRQVVGRDRRFRKSREARSSSFTPATAAAARSTN